MAEVKRTRDWCFIVYPDSAPEDWQSRLAQFHVPFCVSPLHEPDESGDVEEWYKPHWHCMIVFEGVKTSEQVSGITSSIMATAPFRVHSKKGMLRYFCHLDNPDKPQYPIDSIKCFCGFDLLDQMKPTGTERMKIIMEMMDFIDSQVITEFADLARYALKERPDDWLPVLASNSDYFLDKMITSQRYSVYHSALDKDQ